MVRNKLIDDEMASVRRPLAKEEFGQRLPTTPNVEKLALAFKLPVGDVFPNILMRSSPNPKPDFELRTSPSDPTIGAQHPTSRFGSHFGSHRA